MRSWLGAFAFREGEGEPVAGHPARADAKSGGEHLLRPIYGDEWSEVSLLFVKATTKRNKKTQP